MDVLSRNNGVTTITSDRGFTKSFAPGRVFLPDEYPEVLQKFLQGPNVVVIGLTGYSSIKSEHCARWGIKPGAYEYAVHSMLTNLVNELRTAYPGIDIRFVHGASDMGVDKEVIAVGEELGVPQLGFSCPEFLSYVDNENHDFPIYVGADQADYSDKFIQALDILVAANGRKQAFIHDMSAALSHAKYIVPINIVQAISSTGGPAAINEDGTIEDATELFYQRVVYLAIQFGIAGQDVWAELNQKLTQAIKAITRKILPANAAFPI
ncbi:MAG: hypothetical protein WC310_03325 [Patescibacteria group bacterium]|jgi:hypothetical protein